LKKFKDENRDDLKIEKWCQKTRDIQKMATIEQINEIKVHPNADKLELAMIKGFQCIVPKGQYNKSDIIIFIQPDYVLPAQDTSNSSWADEYRKYAPKRIRAIKIRDQYSEGIVLQTNLLLTEMRNNVEYMTKKILDLSGNPSGNLKESVCSKITQAMLDEFCQTGSTMQGLLFQHMIGTDISDLLGIRKYISPDEGSNNNNSQNNSLTLPYNIPKTDEPRFETINLEKLYRTSSSTTISLSGETVDVSLKIDGQSMTVYYNIETDVFGICSRRLQIDMSSKDPSDRRFIAHIERYDLENKLRAFCKENKVSLALRGESYGPGIQSFKLNPHCKLPPGFALFSVFVFGGNLEDGTHGYQHKGSKFYFRDVGLALGIPCVPILEENVFLSRQLVEKYSVGISKLPDGNFYEGCVIKGSSFSFKIINKHYDSQK